MFLFGVEIVLVCIAGVNAGLIFRSEREAAANNRERREHAYRNRGSRRHPTPTPIRLGQDLSREQDSEGRAKRHSHFQNGSSGFVQEHHPSVSSDCSSSQSSNDSDNIEVLERVDGDPSNLEQTEDNTGTARQPGDESSMSGGKTSNFNWYDYSKTQVPNDTVCKSASSTYPPCIFYSESYSTYNRTSSSIHNNSLYSGRYSGYHAGLYSVPHQTNFPSTSGHQHFAHATIPFLWNYPYLQSYDQQPIPLPVQDSQAMVNQPPSHSNVPAMVQSPNIVEASSSQPTDSEAEVRDQHTSGRTSESSESQQIAEEQSGRREDDLCLGLYAGAKLSNRNYKKKVMSLLKNRKPLPDPKVIIKHKRLLRALPLTEYQRVMDSLNTARPQN